MEQSQATAGLARGPLVWWALLAICATGSVAACGDGEAVVDEQFVGSWAATWTDDNGESGRLGISLEQTGERLSGTVIVTASPGVGALDASGRVRGHQLRLELSSRADSSVLGTLALRHEDGADGAEVLRGAATLEDASTSITLLVQDGVRQSPDSISGVWHGFCFPALRTDAEPCSVVAHFDTTSTVDGAESVEGVVGGACSASTRVRGVLAADTGDVSLEPLESPDPSAGWSMVGEMSGTSESINVQLVTGQVGDCRDGGLMWLTRAARW